MRQLKIMVLVAFYILAAAGCGPEALPESAEEDITYQKIVRTELTEPFLSDVQRALESEIRRQLSASFPAEAHGHYADEVMKRGRFENWLIEGSGMCRLSTYDDIYFTAGASLLVWTDDTYFTVCDPSLYEKKYVLPLTPDAVNRSEYKMFSATWDGQIITSSDGTVWLDPNPGFGEICQLQDALLITIGYSGPIEQIESLSDGSTHILTAQFKL